MPVASATLLTVPAREKPDLTAIRWHAGESRPARSSTTSAPRSRVSQHDGPGRHESARARGKAIGGAAVTDHAMLAVALHLRSQELSPRDIAARLVISTGKKKGQHPSPATVMRMLREHDEKAAATDVNLIVR